MEISVDDVHTVVGHAVYLRGLGQNDMPAYFFDLAARMARDLGDGALAERLSEAAKNPAQSDAGSMS